MFDIVVVTYIGVFEFNHKTKLRAKLGQSYTTTVLLPDKHYSRRLKTQVSNIYFATKQMQLWTHTVYCRTEWAEVSNTHEPVATLHFDILHPTPTCQWSSILIPHPFFPLSCSCASVLTRSTRGSLTLHQCSIFVLEARKTPTPKWYEKRRGTALQTGGSPLSQKVIFSMQGHSRSNLFQLRMLRCWAIREMVWWDRLSLKTLITYINEQKWVIYHKHLTTCIGIDILCHLLYFSTL